MNEKWIPVGYRSVQCKYKDTAPVLSITDINFTAI